MAERVQVPVYFPADLYQWLVERKDAGHGSLSQQAVNYCREGRIRDELADAADTVQPSPAALERIEQRIDRGPGAQ